MQFIEQSISSIVSDLYATDFASDNVDLDIQQLGQLNYTIGQKLRMTFVDTFEDTDVDEWRTIAKKNGAMDICVKVNTSTGHIDLNIEYKRQNVPSNKGQWILKSTSLIMAAWSWYHLNLLVPERYPLPIEL
jgi:citrate lyase gamma subunit